MPVLSNNTSTDNKGVNIFREYPFFQPRNCGGSMANVHSKLSEILIQKKLKFERINNVNFQDNARTERNFNILLLFSWILLFTMQILNISRNIRLILYIYIGFLITLCYFFIFKPNLHKLDEKKEKKRKNHGNSPIFSFLRRSLQYQKLDFSMGIIIFFANLDTYGHKWQGIKWKYLYQFKKWGIPFIYFISMMFDLIILIIFSFQEKSIGLSIIEMIIIILTTLSLLSILIFQVNGQDKQYSGIINNGTGCITLLETALYISKNIKELKWMDINIVFTTQDQDSLCDTLNYLNQNKKMIQKYKEVHLVRMDSIYNALSMTRFRRFLNPHDDLVMNILIENIKHAANIQNIDIQEKRTFQPIKYWFLPEYLKKLLKKILIIGDPYPYIKHPKHPDEMIWNFKSVEKITKLLSYVMLNLDKRIEDKIYSGE